MTLEAAVDPCPECCTAMLNRRPGYLFVGGPAGGGHFIPCETCGTSGSVLRAPPPACTCPETAEDMGGGLCTVHPPKKPLRPIVVECTRRETDKTVNGPLTKVTLAPAGPLNSNTGSIVVFVHDPDDLKLYEVGRRFRLVPEAL